MAINAPSQVTTWKIDPMHSSAEFAVKHMMVTTVRGRLAIDGGEIVFDEINHANSSVQTTLQVHTINTGTDQRDTHLKSPDFFNADEHPTSTFKSTKVEHKGEDRMQVHDDLTIHGVTKSVILDTTANGQSTNPYGQTVAGFTAWTQINRKDFGLTYNAALETSGVLVSDNVKITLEIQAAKQ